MKQPRPIPRMKRVSDVVLTRTERLTLPHVAVGRSTREIADIRCLSEHTIKHHVENLLEKFDVPSRTHLALIYFDVPQEAIAAAMQGGQP